MGVFWILVFWLLCFDGVSTNGSPRPPVVNVGAIFSLDSTIGRVAKIAIEMAVKDVNSNSSVLKGTTLNVDIKNTNCSAFIGLAEALQFMGADVVAVIGPQSSVIAHNVLHFANELQTPFLSFAVTDSTLSSPYQFPYFVRTTQNDMYQMTAVAEVVDYYGWREVILIFLDDDYGRSGLSELDDALATRRCKISDTVRIPPGSITRSDIMDILVKVALMETRVIVLHAYPGIGFMVFSVARYLGMLEEGYVWIATDWLSSALDSAPPFQLGTMTDDIQGVLVLRQHVPDSERRRALAARWNNLTRGSLGLSTYGLCAYDTVWLLAHALDTFFNQGGVISFSNDSRLNLTQGSSLHLEAMSLFNGGRLLLKNILQSNFVGLTGAVKFTRDKSLVNPAYDILNIVGTGLHRIGYWSNHSGLSAEVPELLYSMPPNRSRMNRLYNVLWPGESARTPRGWVFPNSGRMLRIGVPRRAGFVEFVSQVAGTNTSEGFCIDVFTSAVALLPYAVPYQFIPFGNGHDNPSYDELVNLITTGVFDGVVGDITIVMRRTKIVDFTQPFAASGLVVVAPVKKVNQGAWAFLRPFSLQMWGVTAAFFIFIGIVVWILEHRINNEFRGPPRQQFITILWFSLSTLFFAHKETTISTLGRAVLIIWLFVVLIINSSYTASLTSILTVQQLYSPIKGIESLKKGNDPIGYQVGSFAERYLVEDCGIAHSRLKALRTPQEYATALQKGPENGGVVALVDERPYVEMFLASHCKFKIIGQEFTKSGWGFAFPRDSPLAIDLSTAILKLSENGDLQRIHDKWLITSTCSSDNELDSDRLHLKSFQGLFLLCGIACCVAFLIYLLQILHKFWQVKSDDNLSIGTGSSRSRKFQTLISIIDEKEDLSRRDGKRRKVEKSMSENSGEIQVERERDSGSGNNSC